MDSPASEACGSATVEESMLLCKCVAKKVQHVPFVAA